MYLALRCRAHTLHLQPTTSIADLHTTIGAADVSLVAVAGAPAVLSAGGCSATLHGLRSVPGSCAHTATASLIQRVQAPADLIIVCAAGLRS